MQQSQGLRSRGGKRWQEKGTTARANITNSRVLGLNEGFKCLITHIMSSNFFISLNITLKYFLKTQAKPVF